MFSGVILRVDSDIVVAQVAGVEGRRVVAPCQIDDDLDLFLAHGVGKRTRIERRGRAVTAAPRRHWPSTQLVKQQPCGRACARRKSGCGDGVTGPRRAAMCFVPLLFTAAALLHAKPA